LSIAGFDGSGGAGLQADLKTFCALGCYGMTVLTAIPIQNTCGVRTCYPLSPQCIEDQLTAIFDDIVPDCIKIGMLFSAEVIHTVADFLQLHAKHIPIALDPVMIAKSGDLLLQADAIETLKARLIPLATVLTPNTPEAHRLAGPIIDKQHLAKEILNLGCQSVFLKGGHDMGETAIDLLMNQQGHTTIFSQKRIITNNTHGTGCTLSAAICAYLARGNDSINACQLAKEYLYGAILSAKHNQLGKGSGPVDHLYRCIQ
jgi:hydroxymethylpyrimidine/phosphomethylpyrimidine kinase